MPCAPFLKTMAKNAIDLDFNQYAPGKGLPQLKNEITKLYNTDLDILITVGATEAIFATCQAFVDAQDEVILFEPFYDSYPAAVKMAGGKPIYVPLLPQNNGDWLFDRDELQRSFNKKTKLIFINTPHNPSGKIFSLDELNFIANLCKEHDVIAVCDEVYEFMVFDGEKHNQMIEIKGMKERTITISSAGKTFGVTGWKVGWIIATEEWIDAIFEARQWISFSVTTPLQYAISEALKYAQTSDYFSSSSKEYQKKRNMLCDFLEESGLEVFKPKGTYFIMANHKKYNFHNDVSFCEHLIKNIGVAAIPPSSFYCKEHKHLAKNFARFCFCKDEETLINAGKKLCKLNNL